MLKNLIVNKKNKEFNDSLNSMELQLNRSIVDNIKQIDMNLKAGSISESYARDLKRELNKDRIKALGLKLIPGGKE